jgi:hypothetical protein
LSLNAGDVTAITGVITAVTALIAAVTALVHTVNTRRTVKGNSADIISNKAEIEELKNGHAS